MADITKMGWPYQLLPSGRYSIEGNKQYTNYSAALTYAKESATSYVGNVVYIENDELVNDVLYPAGVYVVTGIGENGSITQVGKETEVPIKSISLNGQVQDIDDNGNVNLKFEIPAPEDVDLSGYYTKEDADNKFATKEEIPSLDGYLTSSDAESTYVKKEGYNEFTSAEKEKLAGIAEGAEANYVKSVGDNLAVDTDGKLTVTIPEVNVPFQSVSETDKILTLEGGILSSIVTFTKETLEGQEYLVIRGKNNEELGKVSTAEFTADSFLNDVTIENGNINFTWEMADGSAKTDSVDLSTYIKPYNADNTTIELNAETNTFSVKDGVFVKQEGYIAYSQDEKDKLEGIAVGAEVNYINSVGDNLAVDDNGELTVDLSAYAKTENLVDSYSKTEVDNKFVKQEGYIAYSQDEKDKLAGIAEGAQVNVIETIKLDDTELEITNKTVNIDLSSYNNRIVVLENTSSESAENYTKALEFASKSENAGRVIYITNNETIGETEYIAGAYIVTGQNTLLRLSTTSATEETPTDAINRLEGLIANKQDVIGTGSDTTPHVIWSTETKKWVPGKIKILPEYSADNAGQILTVNTDGSEVIWASAPVSTTVTKNEVTEGETQTWEIKQGETSVNVYSVDDTYNKTEVYTKSEVDSFFTWQTV